MEPSKYALTARLLDGTTIFIRAIRPDDRDRLLTHFSHLSPESIRFRFHGFKRSLSDTEAAALTAIDFVDHVALVATFGPEIEQPLIGVGRYIVSADSSGNRYAEVGFAVLDQHQGKGIGTLLLQHLAIIARAQGIDEFHADVLTTNARMIEVFEASGFVVKESVNHGVDHLVMAIGKEETSRSD